MVQAVEAWKGEPWLKFRDRHGDVGRDVALYVGRKRCGMTLAELGKAAGGIDYRSVGGAVSKMARRANADAVLATALENVMRQIKKREM